MPNNNFSIGHDISIDIYDSEINAMVTFPPVTGFSAEPITKQITSEPLNGPPLFAENPNGWKGTIDFDRIGSTVGKWFADREAKYFNGRNLFNVTITETIKEKDYSITQYRYTGVALKLAEAGKWKATDKVSQRIDWVASTRVPVVQ